jgi:hypothetical protein
MNGMNSEDEADDDPAAVIRFILSSHPVHPVKSVAVVGIEEPGGRMVYRGMG